MDNNSERSALEKRRKSPGIKDLIKNLERKELIEVIFELSKVSKKNEQFIKLYIQGSNNELRVKIEQDAKLKLKSSFFKRNGFPNEKINLKSTREIITEYSKVLKDYPDSVLELKLYFVELGIDIVGNWFEMEDGFYNALASMLVNFCNDLFDHHKYYEGFSKRLNGLVSNSETAGHGLNEIFTDMIWNLEGRLGIGEDDYDDEENSES